MPIEYREMPHERHKQQEKIQEIASEEEEKDDDESEDEEEYEEEELEEKVFCHFRVIRRKRPELEADGPVRLTCTFQEVVIGGIYTKENFVVVNEGVYLDTSFYTWDYF